MISYQLQRNRRTHSIKIKVVPPGEVIVVAPADCPLRFIESFLEKQQVWIEKSVAKVQAQRRPSDDKRIDIFGKSYQKVIGDMTQPIGVHVTQEDIIITPVTHNAASVSKSVTQFLKSTAEKYIVPRTHQLAKTMGISFANISLKAQKTRWGSCSSQGNLNFNWRLVHCPPEVIDYVIIHELAHRREMNHSSAFWALVAQYDPEHKKHRGWLRRQGMELG